MTPRIWTCQWAPDIGGFSLCEVPEWVVNLLRPGTELCQEYIDGSAQDCGISSALALEIPQSCAKPLIFSCGVATLAEKVLKLTQGFIRKVSWEIVVWSFWLKQIMMWTFWKCINSFSSPKLKLTKFCKCHWQIYFMMKMFDFSKAAYILVPVSQHRFR